jgi:hypothetical protein
MGALLETYDIHTWKFTIAVVAILVILLGYLFRGFLQEAGKDLYTSVKSRFKRILVPAREEASALQTQYSAPLAQGLEPIPHVPDLTHGQIAAAIAQAPPFQRNHVIELYIGIRVDWTMYLRHASENEGKISIRLSIEPGRMADVTCDVDAHVYPQLRILHENAPLRVSGVISSWWADTATLTDVRLTILPRKHPK